MNALFASLSTLGHSFAWALFHSLWQGLVIYLVLILLLKVVASANARVKYNMSVTGFLLLVLWFGNTWMVQYDKLIGYTVLVKESVGADAQAVTHTVRLTPTVVEASPLYLVQATIEKYLPFLLAIYSVGLLLMIARLAFDFIQVHRLKNSGVMPESGNILGDVMQEWAEKLNIGRNVQLFFSPRINVPVMMGLFKPVILLPIASVNNLTEDQLEAILLHELAHIKRYDYLHNILQAIVETVLFFNPFVWLMSRIIRLQREHCCDDIVLACSARPMIYATALTNLEYNMSGQGLAQAATGGKGQLFNRIKRIMETNNTNKRYNRPAMAAVVLIAFAFALTMLAITPSFAQKVKKKKKAEAASSTAVTETINTAEDTIKRKPVIKITRTSANGKDEDVDVRVSFKNGALASAADSAEFEMAMHQIVIASKDFSTAMAAVGNELDAVDWESMKSDIRRAIDDINNELSADVNMDANVELRKKLEKSRESLDEARRELKEKLVIVREEAAKARAEAADARADIYAKTCRADGDYFESILNKMHREHLIDRNGKFTIEKNGDEFYINGIAQPQVVRDRYYRYLDRKKVTIKGSGGIYGELYISLDDK